MSWNARRASFVLLALFVAISTVWLDQGRAQVKKEETKKEEKKEAVPIPPPGVAPIPAPQVGRPDAGLNPDGFLNNGIHLVKDEKGRTKQIEAAIDYINDEDWVTAVERLQKLLEIDEDVLVRLKRKNAEGSENYVWVSAKQEADRLIGALPQAGKDFYKATYGAKSADLLKKAKKNGDPGLLNDIMKKYAHTEAGAEAIKLLGDYKLDRGEYMPALLCYSKLISRLGEEKVPVVILAKAAWAAHLAPPSASDRNTVTSSAVFSEKELWKMLRSRTREIQLGEQAIPVEDLQEHVAKLDRHNLEQNATDSLLYRATASRSNQLTGGPAYLGKREWDLSLLYKDSSASLAREYIHKAKDALKSRNQPIIPAFSPIALTVPDKQGKKKPLLIYKNFFGVFALDIRDGSLAWISSSNLSLQRLLDGGSGGSKHTTVAQWLQSYQNLHPQVLFENSTIGTLSTDGQYVYAVEDLAVPPMPQQNVNMGFPGGMNGAQISDKDLEDAVGHNRLFAISLATNGKLTWELPDEKGQLADCYFLGPPLPLAGKLYLLADKQQEIRLICLDPTTHDPATQAPRPTIVSTQTLGMTQEKMQNDPLRRTWAAHLAYGEGILVCPTNTGAVFGVNLLENSLAWAYPYRDKNDAPEEPAVPNGRMGGRMVRPGFRIGPDGQAHPIVNREQHPWKASAPVISDGKVVFTAPDARSIHCINLRDGSHVWHWSKQDDDLYLGNVHNGKVLIVGKKNVRALSLSNGEQLWTVETGVPSGQGIGSDNIYYLPLAEAAKDKNAQILSIDMDQGKITSRVEVRNGSSDVPGNLLFAEGKVISVTAYGSKQEGEIAAYSQVKVKLAEMDERILKNPNDPSALTERGELRLDKGDLSGAIDDLTTALKYNPDKELRDKARAKLYDTLTAYITDHFDDAEKYLKEYEDLCRLDLDGAADSERGKLEAEQRRRRATYLWLVGKGREEQGRLVEAFEKYQQFAKEAGKQSELVPAVDDRQVKAAPDVWSRGRIIAMMNNAKPEHREPLEKLIADKWKQLRETNDLQELRSFVRMFGSVSDAGKEARLELVERLMDQKDTGEEHPLLEAELELNQFRTGRHTPELAARATEALARLYTRKGLLEDAAFCYRKLGKEYADIVIRDGKTGRRIYDDEAATDKRLLPYLDDPQPLGSVKNFKAEKKSGENVMPAGGQLFQFEHSGEDLPFFHHHIVGLKMSSPTDHRFMLLDRNLEDGKHSPKEIWSAQLTKTNAFQSVTTSLFDPQQGRRMAGMAPMVLNPNAHSNARFPYSTVGHLIVLPLAHRVFGIDPVNHRVLWDKDLSEGSGLLHSDSSHPGTPALAGVPTVDPTDGTVLLTYTTHWAQRLGQVGPFQGQTICIQSADRLSALDPITGRVLWSRLDVNSRNYLFSDEDYVFVVELDNQNQPNSTRVFHAADGSKVKAPDFSALFAKRLQVFGRHLLVSESGPMNGVVLRLYDVVSGQDVWKHTFPAQSVVARSEDATLTSVVEPEGKVHVIDLAARKEVMTGELNANEHWKGVQQFTLLADRHHFYLAPQAAEANGAAAMGQAPSNVMTVLGMRTVPVNGYLHAFDRGTGEMLWYNAVKHQYLILDQYQDLPVLLLTARSLPNVAAGLGGVGIQQRRNNNSFPATAMSIQKRGGKVVFLDDNLPGSSTNFFGIRIDPRARTVDLLSQQFKITHSPKPDSESKGEPAAAAPAARENATTESSPPKDTRVHRPEFDRARIREIAPPPG